MAMTMTTWIDSGGDVVANVVRLNDVGIDRFLGYDQAFRDHRTECGSVVFLYCGVAPNDSPPGHVVDRGSYLHADALPTAFDVDVSRIPHQVLVPVQADVGHR